METKQTPASSSLLTVVLVLLFVISLGTFLYGNYQAGDSALWQMILNGLILSIPLAALYFMIGVVIRVAQQRSAQGQINPRMAKLIYWTPRVAAIVIIFFVSLFSLDMFGGGEPLGEQLLGFLMHSVPSIVMIIALVIAWKWEWVGFVLFLVASLFFMRTIFFNPVQGLGMFLLFGGPMLLIALLFGANWLWRKELSAALKPPAA